MDFPWCPPSRKLRPARQVACQQVRGQVDIARDVDDKIAGGSGIGRSDRTGQRRRVGVAEGGALGDHVVGRRHAVLSRAHHALAASPDDRTSPLSRGGAECAVSWSKLGGLACSFNALLLWKLSASRWHQAVT